MDQEAVMLDLNEDSKDDWVKAKGYYVETLSPGDHDLWTHRQEFQISLYAYNKELWMKKPGVANAENCTKKERRSD